MLHVLILLLIGFSVIGLAILTLAYLFFLEGVQKTRQGLAACAALSLALIGLQLEHLHYLSGGMEPLLAGHYAFLLFVTPVSFYFFSRDVLMPDTPLTLRDLLHAIPLCLGLVLPATWVAPVAFSIGAGYSVWLARRVYGMRRNIGRFRFEMFFFGLFALLAVAVLLLVLSAPRIGTSAFYLAYAAAIGLAVAMVTAALLVFPEILTDISEAARLAYANSTLKAVNVAAKLDTLNRVMLVDKIYRNENLSLNLLAEAVELSPHQLSELINTRFSVGFSRYIREQRVAEARRILTGDHRSSALSVGMMCGFGSQSNFYAAFKEVTGESPAAFRKRQNPAEKTPV